MPGDITSCGRTITKSSKKPFVKFHSPALRLKSISLRPPRSYVKAAGLGIVTSAPSYGQIANISLSVANNPITSQPVQDTMK